MGSLTARLAGLLRSDDDDTVAAALSAVIARGTHDVGAVAVVCEQLRRKANKPVPLEVALGSHVPGRDVIPHSLEGSDGKPKRRDCAIPAPRFPSPRDHGAGPSPATHQGTRLAHRDVREIRGAGLAREGVEEPRAAHQAGDAVEKGESVLLRGTSGLGKTMLAQNLGLAALTKGRTVLFNSLS